MCSKGLPLTLISSHYIGIYMYIAAGHLHVIHQVWAVLHFWLAGLPPGKKTHGFRFYHDFCLFEEHKNN